MKIVIGLIVIVVLGIGFLAITSGNDTSEVLGDTDNQKNYTSILEEVEAGEAIVLDVRTAQEFAGGHAEKAVNVSLQDIQAGVVPKVDTGTTLYVYCRSGNRSAQVATLLKEKGYSVVDLGGVGDITAIGAQLVQ